MTEAKPATCPQCKGEGFIIVNGFKLTCSHLAAPAVESSEAAALKLPNLLELCQLCGRTLGEHSREALTSKNDHGWKWKENACPIGDAPFHRTQTFVAVERAESPASTPAPQTIWFHGTTRECAELIKRDGFREGTWFARHMEDAVTFGGPVVFFVKVSFSGKSSDEWQVCCSNALPSSSITNVWELRASASPASPPQSSKKETR